MILSVSSSLWVVKYQRHLNTAEEKQSRSVTIVIVTLFI